MTDLPAKTGDVLYPFETLREDVQRALDRDGAVDWNDTGRLADVVAAAVWNNAQLITEERERQIARGYLDTSGFVEELAEAIKVARVPYNSNPQSFNDVARSHARAIIEILRNQSKSAR